MACDAADMVKKIENLKATVTASFARINASLKARELKTLRQLDALRKQCENDKELTENCIQELKLCFDNGSELLDNINNYGAIDFERLNFDSKTFSLEDYVRPEDDHMYSYKTIEDTTKEVSRSELEIQKAALKEMTASDCVCVVNIRSDEVSQKFKEFESPAVKINESLDNSKENECEETVDEKKSFSSESETELKKLDPTDDWINSIKDQIETEPTQVTDVMEHSTITCP